MAKDFEIRERAEELYVIDGLTLDEVAAAVGVSERTVSNWSADGEWLVRQKEYRNAATSIRHDTLLLRKKMAAQALHSLDLQDLYAVVKLETMAARQDKKEEKTDQIDRPALFLEDMEFIAKTLREIDPEGLKIFAINFDVIITRFKELSCVNGLN